MKKLYCKPNYMHACISDTGKISCVNSEEFTHLQCAHCNSLLIISCLQIKLESCMSTLIWQWSTEGLRTMESFRND